jgi:hypothetical protein
MDNLSNANAINSEIGGNGMIVNDELIRIRKEALLKFFLLQQYFSGATEISNELFSQYTE